MELTPTLPAGWQACALGELACVTNGKRLPLGSALVEEPTPHPYVRVTDMRPGTVCLDAIRYVPEGVFPLIRRYRIYRHELFISVAGTLGIVGRVPHALDGANLTENANRITRITCCQDFLQHAMMAPAFQRAVVMAQTVGAQSKLALARIRRFTILQPPPHEQRAIAATLNDVDALLGALDRLIAKQGQLQQATQQAFMSGRNRLPGFAKPWCERRLQDIASVRNQKIMPYAVALETVCVELENLGQGDGQLHGSKRAADVSSVKLAFAPGDVLFGRLRPYLRKTWEADREGLCTAEIWPLVADREVVSASFLHLLVQTQAVLDAASISYGTRMPRAEWSVVGALQVSLPCLAEQHAIVSVLGDMQATLRALHLRRHKVQRLKEGMAQALLTGATRLV